MRILEIINTINTIENILLASSEENFNPSSFEDEDYFFHLTGVEWEEYRRLLKLKHQSIWCSKGYYSPGRCEIHHHTGEVEDYWEYDEEAFASMGDVVMIMEYPELTYLKASWRVRFDSLEASECARMLHYELTGTTESFQKIPKPWRKFYEATSLEDLEAIASKVEDWSADEKAGWEAVQGEFISHNPKPKGWEELLQQLLLLTPSTTWTDGVWGWITEYGVGFAWKVLSTAPSLWDLIDLANSVWEISEENEIPLKLPLNWGKALKYKRKLVQKYEGWDPDLEMQLPALDFQVPAVKGVTVRRLETTLQMLEKGRQYNNCLRTHIKSALEGRLYVWEVIDIETGEGAILGFEECESGWRTTDMFFRGKDDRDVESPPLHNQKDLIDEILNNR